jgi:molybdenum cofactor synthesis domain-containing protein
LRTAAALIIGNEILSGKIADQNSVVLARALRSLGVTLVRAHVVADELSTIRDEVRALSERFDFLFTSGGVGPTHDDVTVDAVAAAFGVGVETSGIMEKLLREYYGDRVSDGHLRMARIPVGARLIQSHHIPWPTVVMHNVWVLPGVPQIFAMKMAVIKDELGADRPFVSMAVVTTMDEGELKPSIDAVVSAHPEVEVGSYPRFRDPEYKTKVTFDGLDPALVRDARDAFVRLVPPQAVVRLEDGVTQEPPK